MLYPSLIRISVNMTFQKVAQEPKNCARMIPRQTEYSLFSHNT